jgi:carbamoyltransferase
MKNGTVLHAVNEERFSRTKLDQTFPVRCIKYILDAEGITAESIDIVALGLFGGANAKSLPMCQVMMRCLGAPNTPALHERLQVAHERDTFFANEAEKQLLALGFQRSQIRWFDHHECHAYSAFMQSPFDDALVITFDGRGDCLSGTVSKAVREKEPSAGSHGMEIVHVTSFFDSIAYLYSITTMYLGYKPFHHEGKLTGLAGRGSSKQGSEKGTFAIFNKAIWLEEEKATNPRTGKPYWGMRTDSTGEYYKAFSTARPPKLLAELSDHSSEDVAAGVQDITEHLVCEYLRRNAFVYPRICLSGGLFANVKLNQRVRELEGVETVHVFPHMGDGGIHIGAAILATIGHGVAPHDRHLSATCISPMPNMFLGPDITLADIEEVLELARGRGMGVLHVEQERAYAAHVSKLLAGDVVVGLVHGRMEFGPRALGHRSILAPATSS